MATAWSTESTTALLSIWGKRDIQSQLDGVVRNRVIYEKIAEDLGDLGFEYSWKQCRTKVKNLVQLYRKVQEYFHSWNHKAKALGFYPALA